MRMRLAKFHPISAFEELLGIRPDAADQTGETVSTWRQSPGECPRGYGMQAWGDPGIVSVRWDPQAPLVWDNAIPDDAGPGVAVFCSGMLLCERRHWRYYEPEGGDPIMLAGIMRGDAMSIVVRAATRFPAVLQESLAEAWILGRGDALQALGAELLPVERTWFRTWPIESPDDAPDNTASIIAPLK